MLWVFILSHRRLKMENIFKTLVHTFKIVFTDQRSICFKMRTGTAVRSHPAPSD